MPYLEQFIRCEPTESIGEVIVDNIEVTEVIATRRFLTQDRLKGVRRRGGQEFPNVVNYGTYLYCIDGHHKIRRALDSGITTLTCRILITENSQIGLKLSRMNHGLIRNLAIR